MVQYINKSALVAKIKERIETYNKGYANGDDRRADALEILLHDLNTLEVKEVDFIMPEEIKKICTIYDNLNQERKCATVLYNSDETFFNHVLMEYKAIAQNIKE